MQRRETPLKPWPERPPYKRVMLDSGTYTIRIPSPHRSAELARALDKAHLVALMALVERSATLGAAAVFEVLRTSGADMLELIGALVGTSWVDEHLEIETPQPAEWDPAQTKAYGRAVVEEMHEAGWSLSEQALLLFAIAGSLKDAWTLEGKVLERARFFAPAADTPTAAEPSSNSGPESPSVEASSA